MPVLASKSTCTGCMACLDRCPHNAIEVCQGSDGHRYVRVNQNLCVECKLCEKTCPIVNGFSYGEQSLKSDFLAGWSEEDNLRDCGATSGIFGTIASAFIQNGGFVAAAVMDGLECKYILTNSAEDIKRMQGSKYTSSNPGNIYSQIFEKLKKKESVLFCGLPCHAGALLNFIPKVLQENLFIIDLVCGGVSSPILIEKFAEVHPDIKSIISFRDKANGWKPTGFRYNFTYATKDGKIISQTPGSKNLVTDGFACELTDRYSCYNCSFAKAHRKSDITIGDLWGDKDFPAEHRRGVSSLIVHSDKGRTLIEQSHLHTSKIEPRKVLVPNHRIFNGASIKRYFPERKMIGFNFKHLSYSSLQRIYAGDLRTKNILWWPMALYRLISFRLADFISKRKSSKILSQIN